MSQPPAGSTWCGELELSGQGELTGVVERGPQHARVRALVRLHGEPLGYLTVGVRPGEDPLEAILDQSRERFRDEVDAHLRAEDASPWEGDRPAGRSSWCANTVEPAGLVSVVVGTRNRSESLSMCLEKLARLRYSELEFVIVDNAPSDSSTRRVVEAIAVRDPRFRYALEPKPGLSQARNCGLAHAHGRYVAFTDDDVIVDEGWIDGLIRGFARFPRVACVTGLVASATLDSPAEEYFESRTPLWSTRCHADLFCASNPQGRGPLFPYSPGLYGTGASMAFDREVLDELGGFDLALGAGTKTRGGEDLDIFLRVMESGRCIAYEAAAVVWHHHRADWTSLERQMFGYGSGLTASLTKFLLRRHSRWQLLRRVPFGLMKLRGSRSIDEAANDAVRPPARVVWQERLGLLAGPYLYLRARAATRRGARAIRP